MGCTSHLVIAMHLHAFWFWVLPLLALGSAPLSWIVGTALLLTTVLLAWLTALLA